MSTKADWRTNFFYIHKFFSVALVTVALFLPLISNTSRHKQTCVIHKPYSHHFSEYKNVDLEYLGSIGPDLGDGYYLFKPTSVTTDFQENIFIYDILQCKIIKLDKDFHPILSFGRKGQGPGEFIGPNYPVFINTGLDGNLYAHDPVKRRVFVYSTSGMYLKEFPYFDDPWIIGKPAVDKDGNLLFFSITENNFSVFNQFNELIFKKVLPEQLFCSLYFPVKNLPNRFRELQVISTGRKSFICNFFLSGCIAKFRDNKLAVCSFLHEQILTDYYKKQKKIISQAKPNLAAYLPVFKNIFMDENGRNFLFYGNMKRDSFSGLFEVDIRKRKILRKYFFCRGNRFLSDDSPYFECKSKSMFFFINGNNRILVFQEEE